MKDSTQYTHDASPYPSLHDENGVCYEALTLLVEDQQPSMNLKLQTFMYRSGLLGLYSCPTPASSLCIIAQLSSTVYTSSYNLHSVLQYLNHADVPHNVLHSTSIVLIHSFSIPMQVSFLYLGDGRHWVPIVSSLLPPNRCHTLVEWVSIQLP